MVCVLVYFHYRKMVRVYSGYKTLKPSNRFNVYAPVRSIVLDLFGRPLGTALYALSLSLNLANTHYTAHTTSNRALKLIINR